jgi:hypothetical protein
MGVMLVKQSYREAQKSGVLEDNLKLFGLVSGTSCDHVFCENAINEVNSSLVEKAEKLGATHVFGVEYRARDVSTQTMSTPVGGTIGYGDAYGAKG